MTPPPEKQKKILYYLRDFLSNFDSNVTKTYTEAYAPIEQEQGEATPQSDFFALGRTFRIKFLTDSSAVNWARVPPISV